MELRHLHYFVTVAEELHFGRAAERLGIAQPPLSQQIKALEDEIGVLLFARTKRHVALTAAGKAFLNEARKTLAQAQFARHAAQRAARGESGQLVVGFVSSAAYDKIPAVFHRMRACYPDVSLVLRDLTSEEQVEALKTYQLDVGLIRPSIATAASLASLVIWREPLVVVLPQSHRLARRKRLSLKTLADEAFIQISRHLAPGFYDQFIQICTRAGFSPKVVQEARTTQTIGSLVAGGLGVAIVPASLQSFQRAGVVYRPLEAPVPTTDIAVVWRPDDPSPALRSFLEVIRQVSGE
ncbi:MAG TPA: LysR family transcriptional regulator [Candidatus Sumerlaeota bacterium]|nr:LysR family transcriptional regulator [Candidatus Sumerlaeota bacterium]